MGRRKSTGARTGYGPEIDGMMEDYCAAVDGLPERNLARAAIKHYIEFMCAQNDGLRTRYEALQKKRYAVGDRPALQIVKSDD